MTKKGLLVLFCIVCISISHSQNIAKKLSKKICKCIEKEKITEVNKMNPCFERVIVSNLKEIYKSYKINTIDELNFEKLGLKIGVILSKECDYALKNFTSNENKFEENFKTEKNLDCSDMKNGEYFYVIKNTLTKKYDTTFVTIKNQMFLERMNNGLNYSLLDIKWNGKCEFDLIFKDSNDNIKSQMSNPGDKYKYEIVSIKNNSFILKLFWRKKEYKIELFKIK